MHNETEKRIASLEKELRELRLEVKELKTQLKPKVEHVQLKQEKVFIKEKIENHDKHLVQLNKAASENVKKPMTKEINTEQTKKQRNFEELIVWLLPKIFMVILVLGVLWGLKLISDFGLLSNSVKIILAYGLSFALFAIAYLMDKRKKDTSQVLSVVLYGGTFIIGILTTAAGAILYNVLSLIVALLLTFIYIAYGLVICYLKKNEVLSIFVIFTSLLLPYLLEYMEFNGIVILLYVLMVFTAMQSIFVKHNQKIALYVAYFFSIVAVQVLWGLNEQKEWIYLGSLIILNAIYLIVWWRLNGLLDKVKTVHEGLLFSLSGLTVVMMNMVSSESELALLLLALIYFCAALYTYKQKARRLVDIMGTLSLLTIFNVLLVINLDHQIQTVLLPLYTFIGLMLALRINAKLMKILYSLLYAFTVMYHLLVNEVQPFWSIEHVNYLLILIYSVILLIYGKRNIGPIQGGNPKVNVTFITDVLPVLITIYFFMYIIKIDFAYISNYQYPYVALLLLSMITFGSFFLSEHLIGKFLRYVLILAFTLSTINLFPIHYLGEVDIWLNIITRLIYAGLIIAFIADLLMEGYFYKSWIRHLKIDLDGLITICIVVSMLLFYSVLGQLEFDRLLIPILVVAFETVLLFATSTFSLWISTFKHLRKVKIMGYIVIAIAIIKLVFFDLDSLNLFIRAILFISIGGIGLLLSNRLLSNDTKDEK